MNGWLLGLILVVGYLALQNLVNVFHFKQIVKAISEISDILSAVSDMPQGKADEIKKAWLEAKTRGAVRAAVGSVILLAIIIFLVALGIHGTV